MTKSVIIVGAFHEVIELVEEANIRIIGLIDNTKTGFYKNYEILANDISVKELLPELIDFEVIITPDLPTVRIMLAESYSSYGFKFCTVVSDCCKISKSATIGSGTIIQSGVNISAESIIGAFAKLNTNCNIMHDVTIGDYTTIAPNACVLGNVYIGKACYIGSNATILPNISICDNVIIGAGAVVTKDIDSSGTYVGIPAKKVIK
ncbi:MAG: hypothetical protein GZ087_11425 [Flavobacterium sp.]|nr:hypothetical protein [Flavobacterium sp.]